MKHLLENNDLLLAMAVLTGTAILLKCTCAIRYQILLRDAQKIAKTRNKWLRGIITKFEACYKLRIPVHNVNCYVGHALERFRFLGFSLKSWENADVFFGLLVTGTALTGNLLAIYYQLPSKWISLHSLSMIILLLILALSEFLFQIRRKRNLLSLQLLDYFENTLKGKLENQYLHPAEQEAYQKEYFEEAETSYKEDNETKKAPSLSAMTENKNASAMSEDMHELITSLLEESKVTEEINKRQEKLTTAATTEKAKLIEEILKEYL